MIAAYKLLSGVLLVSLGVAAFVILPSQLEPRIVHLITALHGDPDNRLFRRLLIWIGGLTPRTVDVIGVGALIYGALHLVEGTGLWLRKQWAEYFTVLMTGLPLPFELYELARRPTPVKAAALVLNALIVAYLAYNLVRERAASKLTTT